MLKLEVGKKYINRIGDVVKITSINNRDFYSCIGFDVNEPEVQRTYTIIGTWFDTGVETSRDLIAEYNTKEEDNIMTNNLIGQLACESIKDFESIIAEAQRGIEKLKKQGEDIYRPLTKGEKAWVVGVDGSVFDTFDYGYGIITRPFFRTKEQAEEYSRWLKIDYELRKLAGNWGWKVGDKCSYLYVTNMNGVSSVMVQVNTLNIDTGVKFRNVFEAYNAINIINDTDMVFYLTYNRPIY